MSQVKIKNIEKAAERIRLAVKNNEKIILYGDSDMDGISSVILLEETINNLGGRVDMALFPDRENDGYGINLKALELLKNKAPALFITLDLGIGNVSEVKIANDLGFEVIIVDHHKILNELPPAKIIIDTLQEGDVYPFKGLCNAGITFKLCEEILGENISESTRNSFLELTGLATIADMVPQIEDNKIFIEEGLRLLKNTFRPALRAFLDILGEGEVLSGGYYKMISALNAAESVNFSNEAYGMLKNSSLNKCKNIAQDLLSKTQYKQQRIKEASEEVERRISQKGDEAIIFEGDPAWKLTLAGAVASIACNRHEKPSFIFKKGDSESCGSVRNPKGTDSVEAMKTCSEFLITYGGHACASGFRVENRNLDKLQDCLNKYFKK